MEETLDFRMESAAPFTGRYAATEAGGPAGEYCALALQGFDGLKYAASMLAGALVLAYTDANRSFHDLRLAHKALDEVERAEEIICGIRVPERACHHHFHLLNALRIIRDVAERLGEVRIFAHAPDIDAARAELGRGLEELRHASRSVPGFEMVDLSQSCCALHVRQPRGPAA